MGLLLVCIVLIVISTIYAEKRGCDCTIKPIDIGFGLNEKSLATPGLAPFRYTKRATGHWGGENGPWYNYNEFSSSEHVGTILGTPSLVINGSTSVGNMPLSKLITKAIFVDVSKEVGDNWNYTLPASKLDEWVATNGPIPDNCVLVVRFGWWSRYPNKNRYLGPSDTDLRWPGFSREASQWVVDSGKIIGIGFDTPLSTGTVQLSTGEEDVIHLKHDIYELAKLNLAVDLPPKFNLIIMPMKMTDGPVAPTRIIAYV